MFWGHRNGYICIYQCTFNLLACVWCFQRYMKTSMKIDVYSISPCLLARISTENLRREGVITKHRHLSISPRWEFFHYFFFNWVSSQSHHVRQILHLLLKDDTKNKLFSNKYNITNMHYALGSKMNFNLIFFFIYCS